MKNGVRVNFPRMAWLFEKWSEKLTLTPFFFFYG